LGSQEAATSLRQALGDSSDRLSVDEMAFSAELMAYAAHKMQACQQLRRALAGLAAHPRDSEVVLNDGIATLRALDADVGVDDLSHAHEHSLEVQVPFLQYLFGELPILPIAVGHTTRDAVLALGMALATLCAAHDLLLIASTDFSHQVPAEVARERDALALDRIRAVDPLGLLAVVAARDISMCGSLPTAIALVAAKAMGVEDGAVLHYHTSGDVTGDTRQVVGYGAVALQKRQRSKRS
ncbi:MAG TPA: AmmeMemoRadiSam system protein B, partial [Armatimonadota bacterium]|nr:AmmeMemoRadiSam system protein B [Armatimonadota bacterium]